jgi:type II secretion system protein D
MNKNKMFLIGMSTKACVAILASLIATVSLAQSAERPSLLRNRASSSLLSNRSANLSRPAAEPVATTDSNSKAKSKQVEPGGRSIEFNQAPVEMVFKVYGELKGVTVLKDPQAPSATITLQPLQGQELTDEEKILAIETILEMNGIHLEPYGEKFCRALPRKDVRRDGLPIVMDPDAELQESTRVVSVMVPFKNISIEEAQKALEGFKSSSGLLLVFERTNSILITDTQSNINRMREIARMIDVTSPVTENVFVRQIRNAVAADIKTALEAIVQKSKEELEKNGKQPSAVAQTHTASPFGLRRNLLQRNNTTPQPAANQASIVTSVSDADRGMIRGKVLILSDERSNKLIIVTSKSNMDFFDKVIEQLDVETVPPTVVKVYRLKYADAEDVSDMINDLIGNAPSGKSGSKSGQNAAAKTSGASGANMTTGRTAQPRQSTNKRTGEPQAGELSKENTTILADKRINGLVVMTQKELVPTVESIIEAMDIKLSQVLIETVIIEVSLGDNLKTGIDWVMGGEVAKSVFMNHGQMVGGGAGTTQIGNFVMSGIAGSATNAVTPIGKGIQYLMKSDKLNLAAVIQASKTDSRTKYVASPIVMTVDNKEASIEATASRQFLTGWSAVSGSYAGSGLPSPNYTAKDIGITLKIEPKINPNGTVVLNVEEEYSQVSGKQTMLTPIGDSYGTQEIDVPVTRKMTADISLENGQSVILGGLTTKTVIENEAGIPILKDIPWIGKWLFGSVEYDEQRSELLVFMTPYVLDDADAAQAEALRRKKTMSDPTPWEDGGWSASELADPVSQKELMRRLKDEWKKQDAERKSKLAMEQAKVERVKQLKALSEEERKVWLKMHKEELEKEAREELEEKMLDEKSQEELKKIAESARKRKLEEANREIEASKQSLKDPSESSSENLKK